MNKKLAKITAATEQKKDIFSKGKSGLKKLYKLSLKKDPGTTFIKEHDAGAMQFLYW